MRQPSYSGQFKRDVQQARRRGKDMERLKELMGLLIEGKPLPAHPLKGMWRGFFDAHIEPDWVLIYKATDSAVRFERTGRHVDLFKG